MRIDHPIEITPELITSLNSAVKAPSGAQFALLLSMMSVRGAASAAAVTEPLAEAPEQDARVPTVDGAAFLTIIQRSQGLLQ